MSNYSTPQMTIVLEGQQYSISEDADTGDLTTVTRRGVHVVIHPNVTERYMGQSITGYAWSVISHDDWGNDFGSYHRRSEMPAATLSDALATAIRAGNRRADYLDRPDR